MEVESLRLFPTFKQEVGQLLLWGFFFLSFLLDRLFFLTFCVFFCFCFIHSSPASSFVAVAPLLVISCFVVML